jgi:hypothetical protein
MMMTGEAMSRYQRALAHARRMATFELKAALSAEPEGTTLWLAACEEAERRAKWGSLNPRYVPQSYLAGKAIASW